MKPTIREQKALDFYISIARPSPPTRPAIWSEGQRGWRACPVVTPGSLHGLPAVLPVLSRRRHLAA